MNNDYVATVYNEEIRPKTGYPNDLAGYLIKMFGISQKNLLVDVGCGRGDFMIAFKNHGLKVEGLDNSDFSVSELAKNGITVHKINIATARWPLAENSADIVFSKSVLEHLHNPEHFMNEAYRILKPGGRIIIMTPDWEKVMNIFYDDHTHVQPYTIRSLKKLLLMTGFREVLSERFYQLPVYWRHPRLSTVSKILHTFLKPNPDRRNKFLRWSVEPMCLGSGIK